MTETTEDTRKLVQIEMICVCNEEGQEESRALRQKFKDAYTGDAADAMMETNLVSMLVGFLYVDYACAIDGIYMDQWFGVAAGTNEERFFAPCDRVEDGLLAIWDYLASK